MRNLASALLAVFGCLGAGLGAHAQEEDIYTVWVIRNGSGPQPFVFGYGRTLELAEAIAFRVCGEDCTVIKSGPGCVSITMQNEDFYPRGCGGRQEPDAPAENGKP
jgi:hypothetical protein